MIKTNLKLILLLFILGFNLPNLLFSQEIQSPSDSIGYENNDNLGGPKSVGRQLEVNNNKVLFKHRFEGQTLKKLYDWKARLNEKHGIIGFFELLNPTMHYQSFQDCFLEKIQNQCLLT